MKINKRKTLFSLFILAFFIITPTLILYAMGYNLESGFRLQKSGILIIKTQPEEAKIYLNGKLEQEFFGNIIKKNDKYVRTPAKIKNLKPGEYEIRVELDGYWPWQKKLTVRPGETTFAEDIFLFRNENAVLIAEFESGKESFSYKSKLFSNISANEASVINLEDLSLKNKSLNNGTSSVFQLSEIKWSDNDKRILTNTSVFNYESWEKVLDLRPIFGEAETRYAWHSGRDDSLYFSQGNRLFSYDFSNKQSQEIINLPGLQEFYSIKDDVLLLANDNGSTALSIIRDNAKNQELLASLPFSDYSFLETKNEIINLLDKRNKILYLIDSNSSIKPIKDQINGCSIAHWTDDQRLLYSDGYEIWTYTLNDQKKELLTRISERINALVWHPSENYVIYSTENSLNILELDRREKHNVININEYPAIGQIALDKSGKIIYFSSHENSVTKLYKIVIQ
jgi:hypothetical protein